MDTKNKSKIDKEAIFITIGSLLLIISFILFHYEKILEVNDRIYNSIQGEIYKENMRQEEEITVDINVSYLEENKEVPEVETPNINYLAFLEIEKINLYQGILPKNSRYNHVDYHVEILDISDTPDVLYGNVILAGHSGTSNVAYFKNLYKLTNGDTAKLYYQWKTYKYEVKNIYFQLKDGSVKIFKENDKTTLTLITCTKDDSTSQTIYILELIGVESY